MKVINFMGPRKLCAAFSLTLVLASLVSLAVQQLNWGLDFTGGTLVEVYYSETADLNAIRNTLATGGYEGATVVSFGTDRDILIRLPQGHSDAEGQALLAGSLDSITAEVLAKGINPEPVSGRQERLENLWNRFV